MANGELGKIMALASAVFILGVGLFLVKIIMDVSQGEFEEAQNETKELHRYVVGETISSILMGIVLFILGVLLFVFSKYK